MGAGADDGKSPADTAADAAPPSPAGTADTTGSNEINLVIDSSGHGTFHIATRGTCKKHSHLTFDIQIDEGSQRYLIHTSMGRLDKIRDIHPGMNILRTLSYWNTLQKKRYGSAGGGGNGGEECVRGGQLGTVAKSKRNMVMMTLMGDYVERRWEYDATFQVELERFVEDALQFHLCLNGDSSANGGGGEGEMGASDHGGLTGWLGGGAGSRDRDGLTSPASGSGPASSSSSGGSGSGAGGEEKKRAKGKLSSFLKKIH